MTTAQATAATMNDKNKNPLAAHFQARDFACRCRAAGCPHTTAKIKALPFFGLDKRIALALAAIRRECGFGLIITSGLRCRNHPAEKKKKRGGAHSAGFAIDLRISGANGIRRGKLLAAVFARFGARGNVKGVGVDGVFTHLDCDHPYLHRPHDGVVWYYPAKAKAAKR